MAIPETAGRYRIIRLIGKGAMGRVYLARDPRIDRHVALKTICDDAGLSPEEHQSHISRIISEAKAAGKLLHPNIVTVFDVFEDEGSTYIAMEYLEGTTLDKFCSPGSKLPTEKLLDIISQALSALDYAHKQGVVHRDIKPSNIMILEDGTAKITDFGLARSLDAPLSRDGFLVGTPHYMSPEQVDGKPADGRSDLFSLGVVLYELAAGIRPFEGDTISTILKKILFEDPPFPVEPAPSIPPRLFAIIMKALAKKPEDRFQTAAEFQRAIMDQEAFRTAVRLKRPQDLLPPPPKPVEKREKYSVDWKVVAIAGASGGIFTLMLLFGIQYFLSADNAPFALGKPRGEEVLPKPLEVRTEPPGAALFLDGKRVQIPILSENDRRKHKLVARKGCLSGETEISSRTPEPVVLKLAPGPFQFRIDSEPRGAMVFVDGEETGFMTPALLPRADCSAFVVMLKMEGFSDLSREIDPYSVESLQAPMSQKALEGKIKLHSPDSSLKFFEEGKLIGRPGDLATLPEGRHTISIVNEHVLGKREVSVNITPGETTELSAEPFRTGSVFLVGRPEEDGTVTIDGRPFGDLPLTGEKKLAVGKHEVVVTSSKGRRVRFDWKVREGEQKKVVDFARKKVSDI